MDLFFQTKPKGISTPEVNFCIGGNRGSLDSKYMSCLILAYKVTIDFSPYLCLGETNTEHFDKPITISLQCFGQ
jgi:hypothetical protein